MNSIKLENFQSHVSTTIKPAPPGQLTVIVGPSDSGKTAILRGLRWLFNDEPQGADFIRAGTDFARVTIQYEGPESKTDTVVRYRTSGGTNRYLVNGEKLEGFGKTGVPLEVSQITGVRPVTIGDLELNLNIAEQLSGPFLGSSISAPARAKVLGKLAGTEEIDEAGKMLGTDLYRRNQDEKRLAGELERLQERIGEYDWLPGAKGKIETLEVLAEKIKAAQERRGKLAGLAEQARDIEGKITREQGILYRWRDLERAENVVTGIIEKQLIVALLSDLTARYREYQKVVLDCGKVIERHKGLDVAERLLQGAEGRMEKTKRLQTLKAKYVDNAEAIYRCEAALDKLQGLAAAERLLQGVREKTTRRNTLEGLALSYGKAGMLIAGEQVKLKPLQRIAETGEALLAFDSKYQRRAKLDALRARYIRASFDIQQAREQAVLHENRVAELEGAYRDLLQSAGVCPLCQQPIPKSMVVNL